MSDFDLFIGIDYSGAQSPCSRLPGLQVYAMRPGTGEPEAWAPPGRVGRNWTRGELARLLRDQALAGVRALAGIDHAFSFPASYLDRYGLGTWEAFLEDFLAVWPAHLDEATVEDLRRGRGPTRPARPAAQVRGGQPTELRLTDRWSVSAKSVFQFDVQGSVAKSSHAGIPWLKWLRDQVGARLHVWPFDGWRPAPGTMVLAEVYPSMLRRRYPREGRTVDQHDAWSVARWMADMDARGALMDYFEVPLTAAERALARREGWILGLR